MSRSDNGRKAFVRGIGSYLPERIMNNEELTHMVETSDEWIVTRTGIRERHIAADDEAASHMAAEAGRRAIAAAGISPEDIDSIIVATLTQDASLPSTACFVQNQIGAGNAFCMDLAAACTGFIYGLETARGLIETGIARNILLVGSEKLSAVTDWTDRTTCVLFGDGAGAAVISGTDKSGGTSGRGIIGTVLGADGSLAGLLQIPAGGSRMPASEKTVADRMHYIKMSGNDVFKHAVRCMCDSCVKVMEKCEMTIDDIACVIPHQANIRIINAIANRLNANDKFYVNVDKVGNMSAASIPVALDQAMKEGRVKEGDAVLMVAFGGGFTWGATIVEI